MVIFFFVKRDVKKERCNALMSVLSYPLKNQIVTEQQVIDRSSVTLTENGSTVHNHYA